MASGMRQLAGTQSKVPKGSRHSARRTHFRPYTLRIDYIRRAIDLNATNAEYWSNLAAIYMTPGQWWPALAAADQAIEISEAMTAAHFQKGRAHAKPGQAEAAFTALQTARAGGFNRALVAQEIGTVLQSIGDLAGCVKSFEESLRMNPDQPSVWLSLSRLVTASDFIAINAPSTRPASFRCDNRCISPPEAAGRGMRLNCSR